MGCIYSRGNSLWIKFKNEAGSWQCKASGFKVGDERKAKALLERVENLVSAGQSAKNDGPLTVRSWAEMWLETRRAKGVLTVRHYHARVRDHILPVIGHMRLDAVRVSHIMEIVARARGAKLAPRTVRHIYFVAHAMFRKAVQHELIVANPCSIDKDDLPAKVDKNPEWRARAIHTRDELEALISDKRIPEWRRMFWALLFLTGMRFGEGAARRWRHYDPDAKPLGKLVVNTSYNNYFKIEKEPKTKQQRDVPVHPVLAALLAEWKLGGWERAMGRKPTDDDLIVPCPEPGKHFGRHLEDRNMLRRFHRDLETLGMRWRRQHDTRRTFISLCLSDGARKEILKWVTHSRPQQDQMDDYTTLLYAPLCDEVAKLKVQLRREPERAIAVANAPSPAAVTPDGATVRATVAKDNLGIARDLTALDPLEVGGGGGIRTPGAFALRFSRPSPSTTRPLLRTDFSRRTGAIIPTLPGSRSSRTGARLVADDGRVGDLAEHDAQRRLAETNRGCRRIRFLHRLPEHGHRVTLPQHHLAVARAPLLRGLAQHAFQDAAPVVAEVKAVRGQEPADVLGRGAAFVPGRGRLVAPPGPHLLQADLGPLHPDQRRAAVVVHEEVLPLVLDDPPGRVQEAIPRLRDRPVPDAGRAGQGSGERRRRGPQPADDLDHLAHPRPGDRGAPVLKQRALAARVAMKRGLGRVHDQAENSAAPGQAHGQSLASRRVPRRVRSAGVIPDPHNRAARGWR
jgi:integrase